MEWAIPPRPQERFLPSMQSKRDSLESAALSRLQLASTFWARAPIEAFQSPQLTTIDEDSSTVLPLQLAISRFMNRLYIPSGNFLDSPRELPADVRTIMEYYSAYFKQRAAGTYNPAAQWSYKYTGEAQGLDALPSKTPWDQSYKYYRWNFADPSKCDLSGVNINALAPNFEFHFTRLNRPIIYTYAHSIEAFQGTSLINTGKVRIESANQKFKNGTLIIMFDTPQSFDGYNWTKDITEKTLRDVPATGWVLQGSNDDSVWSDTLGPAAYRDNLQLDSPKWQTLHMVKKSGEAVDDALTSKLGKQNVEITDRAGGITLFNNTSRAAMLRHLKQATLSMLNEYIKRVRQTYVTLPASLQSSLAPIYKDVERDLSDTTNEELNEDVVDELVRKYVYESTGAGTIKTLLATDQATKVKDASGAAAEIAAGFKSQNDSTKYLSLKVPSDLPLVPAMLLRVSRDLASVSGAEFEANIYNYDRTTGALSLFRLRNFATSITASNIDSLFNNSELVYRMDAFFYDTETRAPTLKTTAAQLVSAPAVGQRETPIATGATYTFTIDQAFLPDATRIKEANIQDSPFPTGTPVRVYNSTNEFSGFKASVTSYTSGSITVQVTGNMQGTFSTSTTYIIKPEPSKATTLLLTPVAEGDISFYVDSGLSYGQDQNYVVRVTNKADTGKTFEATVKSYNKDTGFLQLRRIANITGSFREPGQYSVNPVQNAAILRMRDLMRIDIKNNLAKIFAFCASCEAKSISDTQKIAVTIEKTPTTDPTRISVEITTRDPKTQAPIIILEKTTLDKIADMEKLDSEKDNLSVITEIYNKYNTVYGKLIETNIQNSQTFTTTKSSVSSAEDLGLFEEPGQLRAVTAYPEIVMRQVKRVVNDKMRQFYNNYYFDTVEETIENKRGAGAPAPAARISLANLFGQNYTRTKLIPVQYTKYYESKLRDFFTLDPITGKSPITNDYDELWKITYDTRKTTESGAEIKGLEIIKAMDLKYDALIQALERNKRLANERMKTIQFIELFEEFYTMITGVITTFSMRLPPKSARDNDRLVIAPNSSSAEELVALRDKYVDYMYTSVVIQNYVDIPNDLWTCTKNAVATMLNGIERAYTIQDPTPEGPLIALNTWTRDGVDKPYFQELEDIYQIATDNRPSVIYNTRETIRARIQTLYTEIIALEVFKKPEAGDTNSEDTLQNLKNYQAVQEKIKEFQKLYVRLFNAKELLDPVRESNKPYGMVKRTRDSMQIDRTKIRVRTLVTYYKKLYEAFVDTSGVNLLPYKTWDYTHWQYDLTPAPEDLSGYVGNLAYRGNSGFQYEYIVYVWKDNGDGEKYTVRQPEAEPIRAKIASFLESNESVEICSNADIMHLVNSNIPNCACGWVSDYTDSARYPSGKSAPHGWCGNGTYTNTINCDVSGWRDTFGLYLKLKTNKIIHLETMLSGRFDIAGVGTNVKLNISYVTENSFNESVINDKPTITINFKAINYNPRKIFDDYRILYPESTDLDVTLRSSLPIIGNSGSNRNFISTNNKSTTDYEKDLTNINNAQVTSVTGANSVSDVERRLIDLETFYIGTLASEFKDGAMYKLLAYARSLGIQLRDKLNHMLNTDAYKAKIENVVGTNKFVLDCIDSSTNRDEFDSLTNAISFLSDRDRADVFRKIDNLLNKQAVCTGTNIITAIDINSYNNPTIPWRRPAIVAAYMDRYNRTFRLVAAYEYALAQRKIRIGRFFVEYLRIYDQLTKGQTHVVLPSPVDSTISNRYNATENDVYYYEGNAITTIPDANARLGQLFNDENGWINYMLDKAKISTEALFKEMKDFYTANNGKSWYSDTFISTSYRNDLSGGVAGRETFPDLSVAVWTISLNTEGANILASADSAIPLGADGAALTMVKTKLVGTFNTYRTLWLNIQGELRQFLRERLFVPCKNFYETQKANSWYLQNIAEADRNNLADLSGSSVDGNFPGITDASPLSDIISKFNTYSDVVANVKSVLFPASKNFFDTHSEKSWYTELNGTYKSDLSTAVSGASGNFNGIGSRMDQQMDSYNTYATLINNIQTDAVTNLGTLFTKLSGFYTDNKDKGWYSAFIFGDYRISLENGVSVEDRSGSRIAGRPWPRTTKGVVAFTGLPANSSEWSLADVASNYDTYYTLKTNIYAGLRRQIVNFKNGCNDLKVDASGAAWYSYITESIRIMFDGSLSTLNGLSSTSSIPDIVSALNNYYTNMVSFKTEAIALKPKRIIKFNSDATVKKTEDIDGDVVTFYDVSSQSTARDTQLPIVTKGYKKLDYLLVGGGGPGGGGENNGKGGGGGGSGYFKASQKGSAFEYNSATRPASTDTYDVYDSAAWKGSDGWKEGKTKLTTIDITKDKYYVSIGSGGTRSGTFRGKSTVLYDICGNLLVEATGGYRGLNGNEGGGGGNGSNDGGYGAKGDTSSGGGQSYFGGSGGPAVYTGKKSNDNAGGSGGGGIGSGSGGTGASTHDTYGSDSTGGTNYSGAGGGGGAYWDSDNESDGSPGGHGFAVIVLNYGMDARIPENKFAFLTPTLSAEAFQTQNPYNPQEVQRKILTQKLNAVQFTAIPTKPKQPTLLQSLFSFFK